ncbi:MAG: S9 family peptidase [Gemmatimonadales bacterium]|nr:MAG: S9 family peptidase [Gemmatimonadales bacterium]
MEFDAMSFDALPVEGLRRTLLVAATFLVAAPAALSGQTQIFHEEGYLTPPAEIAAVVEAPRHENVTLTNLAPGGQAFLNTLGRGMPPLEDFARPSVRLGGLALDPVASRSQGLTTGGSVGIEFIDPDNGSVTTVDLPAGVRVTGTSWSPDGSQLAFTANYETESHIYVADVSSGQATRLTSTPLLATRVSSASWSGTGEHIFAVVQPQDYGTAPPLPVAPTTPMIRVTSEDENRLRTYPSLLADPHEKDQLEYYTTGQLVRISVADGSMEPIGEPAMFESVGVSPLGDFLRVRTTQRPFSYIVPVSQFGDVEEIWDLDGQSVLEIASRDVRKGVQGGGNNDDDEPARRSLTWRPDGQGLSYLQRDPEAEGNNNSRPDRVMQWLPPFGDDDHEVVFEASFEIRSVQYSEDMEWIFITRRQGGTDRMYAVRLDDPETRYTIWEWERSEFHENPGSLMTRSNDLGRSVVRFATDGSHVYLSGTQYFEDPMEEAPRPFVDRVEIQSGETERIWQSAEDMFERVTAIFDDDIEEVMLLRENRTTVPDSWRFNRVSGDLRQMTENVDFSPEITNARRERVMVPRHDGVEIKVDVTLPHDWDGQTPLPAMFWHYPREYGSAQAYENTLRTYNKNSFPSVGTRSMEILTLMGYAVVQPDHPTIGDSNRINDNYLIDLRSNHLAVIDELSERGWIDRRRLGLGGHSYGGFGTINAMVHTPYFRAGIAGAPNSNRQLTPIGFQSERRTLWEARETYGNMSPFMFADQLTGALLIYHGEDDQNVGTFPDNSWRLIHALNGLGKTAALYMYPFEGHGQVTRETILDMWTRWVAWLDHYVKNADPSEPVAPVAPMADQDVEDGEGAR